jgi:predicted hydrocarbon binding protein
MSCPICNGVMGVGEEYTGNHFNTKHNIDKEIGKAFGRLVKRLDELESTIQSMKKQKRNVTKRES